MIFLAKFHYLAPHTCRTDDDTLLSEEEGRLNLYQVLRAIHSTFLGKFDALLQQFKLVRKQKFRGFEGNFQRFMG